MIAVATRSKASEQFRPQNFGEANKLVWFACGERNIRQRFQRKESGTCFAFSEVKHGRAANENFVGQSVLFLFVVSNRFSNK